MRFNSRFSNAWDWCSPRKSRRHSRLQPTPRILSHTQTLVKYTYKIKPAEWMADPEARKVFPMVDRIIRGAGVLEMNATLEQKDGKWVPVLPG